jgi:[ribosomal protein S5]-alanine N-acetyltransferase
VTRLPDLDLALRSERLVLAPLSPADVDDIWPIARDPEFPRFMLWEAPRQRSETEAFIAHISRQVEEDAGISWSLREGGEFRGVMGLHGIVRQRLAWRFDCAELGYWLAPAFQGRGLTPEAGRAVLHFGFTALGLHKITCGCISENEASRRVIEKLGFRLVGERRDHMYRHGRWWSHLDYELLIDHWPGLGA